MATQTPIKYLVTDDAISFYRPSDRSVRFVNRQTQRLTYDILRDSLVTSGNIEVLEQHFNPKNYYLNSVKAGKDIFGIKERLDSLTNSGMPTAPFEKFVSRLSDSFFSEERNIQFIARVGTVDAPLTLDGDVVLYQRASWISQDITTNWSNSSTFTSGNVISGERNQTVGEFNWVMNTCPDAGSVFEVLVQPEHIVTQTNSSWSVSQLTQLSKLSEEVFVRDRAETAVVSFNTNCASASGNAIRLPYSPATMSHYVSMLFADKAEAMNNVVPVVVEQVGSC
jgi:hypothetical protein